MTDWNEMLVQLDKEKLKITSERWTSAQGLQLENEFPEPNAVPFGMTPSTPNATSFSTIILFSLSDFTTFNSIHSAPLKSDKIESTNSLKYSDTFPSEEFFSL